LVDSDVLVAGISQAAPVVGPGGGIVAGHRGPEFGGQVDGLDFRVEAGAGLVAAGGGKLTAVEDERLRTVGVTVVGFLILMLLLPSPKHDFM
jgi:hypothetical protein